MPWRQGSAARKADRLVLDHLAPTHVGTMICMNLATAPTQAPVEAPPLAANLCWLLSQASHTLTTELTAGLESVGISPRAHCVLSAALGGPHTQIELARVVGLDKTTMVVTLDELEAAGLAERQPSSEDRRAHVITVTKAGRQKVREAEKIVGRIHADVLDALPVRDRTIFLDALNRLVTERLSEPAVCSQPVRRRAPRA
jgi:MarR family transcriptional regulator, transcriptional regulator for hemolysin